MKNQINIILLSLLIVVTTMQAQTPLTAARNSFRDGDRIVKQETESTHHAHFVSVDNPQMWWMVIPHIEIDNETDSALVFSVLDKGSVVETFTIEKHKRDKCYFIHKDRYNKVVNKDINIHELFLQRERVKLIVVEDDFVCWKTKEIKHLIYDCGFSFVVACGTDSLHINGSNACNMIKKYRGRYNFGPMSIVYLKITPKRFFKWKRKGITGWFR